MRKHTAVVLAVLLVAPRIAAQADPADPDAPAPEPTNVTPPTPVFTVTATPGDAPLLAALLRLEQALGDGDENARAAKASAIIRELAALKDERAVPALDRLSRQEQTWLRFSALGALGAFLDDDRARARLEETMLPGAPPDDAAVALPYLLELARNHPGAKSVACPADWTCAPDEQLLAHLLAYADAPAEGRAAAVTAVGALDDPRAIPFVWRQSHDDNVDVRLAALDAIARVARDPIAKQRLADALTQPSAQERSIAVRGLSTLPGDDVTELLLAARVAVGTQNEPELRQQIEAVLQERAPEKLAALIVEEQQRLADEANRPGQFDIGMRTALTVVAAVGAASGAAAASSVVADDLQPGSGGCYAAWGACAGGASAAAIGWFGLGDRKLDGAQVGLAVSASAWGAWAGLLVPPTIGPAATRDVRHMIYSAAAGQLVGLTLGTMGALASKPSGVDVGEMNAIVLASNALTAGVLLSLPPSSDARPLWGALAGATIASSVGAVLGAPHLSLDETELGHTALLAGITLAAGATAATALQPAIGDGHPTRIGGLTLVAAGLGAAGGLALGHFDLAPTQDGMIYETWAAATFGVAGAGAALFADSLVNPTSGTSTQTLAFGSAALGVTLGAASTALFRDGIPQDSGDLLLQPLMVGFGLYHGAALASAAGADARLIGAGAMLTPALASAGLVYAAPHIAASNGDVLMVASMMGVGAYTSSMVLLSAQGHGVTLDPAAFVLWTSLAMDAGIAGGVLLDMSGIDYVGWKTTYVLAVAAGTTLIVSLPGSLLASGSYGAVAVSDVMLGSSLLGAAIGLATLPLIDFRVAPDWGLGTRPDGSGSNAPAVSVKPGLVALMPSSDGEVPLGLGLTGRF